MVDFREQIGELKGMRDASVVMKRRDVSAEVHKVIFPFWIKEREFSVLGTYFVGVHYYQLWL